MDDTVTAHEDRIRELIKGFLDAYGERVEERLSESLRQGRIESLQARTLFDLAASCLKAPPGPRLVEAIQTALAGPIRQHELPALVNAQIALWTALHTLLRDIPGPYQQASVIHAVLALAGDTVDEIIGALIDAARTEEAPAPLPGRGTLVELGRTCRELQMLTRLSRDLLETREPVRMFQVLQDGILSTFHLRSIMIAAVDHAQGIIEVVCAYPTAANTRDPIGWRFHLSDPDILCDVARSGRTEAISGWDPRFHERVAMPDGTFSYRQRPKDFNRDDTAFFIPLMAGGRAVGVVATGATREGSGIVHREIERMRPFLDQVGATLALISEIAERRRTEEALRESETRLSLALDAARMGAWESHFLTGKLTWSETVEPMFGFEPGTFKGTRDAFYESVHPEDREKVTRAVERAIAQRTAFEVEHRIVWPDGAVRWVESKGQIFRDTSGKVVSMLGVIVDVTERKRTEEIAREAERTRVLVETAGAAAHEISHPLTTLIGLTQLMLMDAKPGISLRQDLEALHQASQRIREIVAQMDSIRRYTTKPYVGATRIVDLNASSGGKAS